MIKIKPVVLCASIALALSFFISLFSRNSFPISLLKAAIFAAVFAGIAVGIQVVYDKFLSEGETSISEPRAPQQKVVGSKVDLVVSEEDLPNEENAPTFALDSTRHVLTAADVGIKTASVAEKPAGQNARSERPREDIADGASRQASLGDEAAPKSHVSEETETVVRHDSQANSEPERPPASHGESPARTESSDAAGGAKSSSVGDDELPELDDFPALGGDDSESKQGAEDEGVVEDSDFAEEGSPSLSRRTEFADGTIADSKDASLMAEAIRTVLVKDE